jgi:hypothetical protein
MSLYLDVPYNLAHTVIVLKEKLTLVLLIVTHDYSFDVSLAQLVKRP